MAPNILVLTRRCGRVRRNSRVWRLGWIGYSSAGQAPSRVSESALTSIFSLPPPGITARPFAMSEQPTLFAASYASGARRVLSITI